MLSREDFQDTSNIHLRMLGTKRLNFAFEVFGRHPASSTRSFCSDKGRQESEHPFGIAICELCIFLSVVKDVLTRLGVCAEVSIRNPRSGIRFEWQQKGQRNNRNPE